MIRSLLASALFIPVFLTAQPTWTNSDEASIGSQVDYYVLDSNATAYSGIDGADATWDYSTVSTYSFDGLLGGFVENASQSKYASFFPSASNDEFIKNHFHRFTSVSSSSKVSYGIQFREPVQDFDALLTHDVIDVRQYPFDFTDNESGTLVNAKIVMNPGEFTEMSFDADGAYDIEYDAHGDITVGDSTIEDVMRIHSWDSVFANLPLFSTSITLVRNQYEYFKKGTSFPVFIHSNVRMYGSLFNEDFTLVLSPVKPLISVGTAEISKPSESVSIYPNPANRIIQIDHGSVDIHLLKLLDARGSVVLESLVDQPKAELDVSMMKSGIYFLVIEDQTGEIQTEKVIVQ